MAKKGKKAMKYIIGESKEDDLIVATLGEVVEAIDKDMRVYMGKEPYWARIPRDETHFYVADPYDFLYYVDINDLIVLDEEKKNKEIEIHALL